MRHHAGIITGAMIGNSIDAAGTNGTAVRSQHLPRYPSISGSIREIGIPDRLSSSMSCNNNATTTSRGIPWCDNSISNATRSGPCKGHLLGKEGPGKKNKECPKSESPDSRMFALLPRASRVALLRHGHKNHKGEVAEAKTFGGPVRSIQTRGVQKFRIVGRRLSQSWISMNRRHRNHGNETYNSKTRVIGAIRTTRANKNGGKHADSKGRNEGGTARNNVAPSLFSVGSR